MKKQKIIALTSILTFSFFIFPTNVFAEDTLTNQNIISKENSINTAGSENKPNQESKTAANETKNDKIDNSQNNNIKKENTEDKKVVSEVNNTNSVNKEANNKAENKDTDKNKVSNPPTSKEIVNSDTKEVNANIPDKNLLATPQQVQLEKSTETFSRTNSKNISLDQVVNIPDKNFKVCLNRNLYYNNGVDYSHDNDPITVGKLKMLTSINRCNTININNLKGIEYCENLTYLNLAHNKIENLRPLSGLTKLATIYLNDNNINDMSPLSELANLNDVVLCNNNIVDISSLNNFKSNNFKIEINNQGSINLNKTIVDDGSSEIDNPIKFPKYYRKTFNLNISPSGDISSIQDGNKFSLNNLIDSDNQFTITESADITNGKISGNYSINLNLPVEHVSTIKVDLPTSMTFDVVTNTIDPKTNRLKPTFVTDDYTIKNRGKKPVTITPSYSVINQGGVDLVENISDSDISKNNDVKIAVKLKNLSTDKEIMSVVDKAKGTPFDIGQESSIQLRFEPGENGMADAEKEQLSDTKSTLGKMIFTISN